MCGIAGIVNSAGVTDADFTQAEKMARVIAASRPR